MAQRFETDGGTAFVAPLVLVDEDNEILATLDPAGVEGTITFDDAITFGDTALFKEVVTFEDEATFEDDAVFETDVTIEGSLQVQGGGSPVVNFPANAVKTIVTTVDASAGGTAQTTNVGVVPAGAILLGVLVRVTEEFDGDTTTTLEVGVSGNADKYIEATDFDPSDATSQACNIGGANNDQTTFEYIGTNTTLVATWTNTASATEGIVEVTVLYV